MAEFGISQLIEAAKLADELSASRRKSISLTLRGQGILIAGRLFDPALETASEYNLEITWPQIVALRPGLVPAIREIDRKLVADWRSEPA